MTGFCFSCVEAKCFRINMTTGRIVYAGDRLRFRKNAEEAIVRFPDRGISVPSGMPVRGRLSSV